MPDQALTDHLLTTIEELEAHFPPVSGLATIKLLSALDQHCRNFIARSPMVMIGTVGDVSPKGDNPGFVQVIDDKTLLIPDRRGNNLIDSMRNIIDNPKVGLLFLIPGIDETLRVNGQASLTTDPALLEPHSANRKVPDTGYLIHVEQAFYHCAKAFRRSKLWDVDTQIDRKELIHPGRAIAEKSDFDPDKAAEMYDQGIEKAMKDEGRE